MDNLAGGMALQIFLNCLTIIFKVAYINIIASYALDFIRSISITTSQIYIGGTTIFGYATLFMNQDSWFFLNKVDSTLS